MMTTDRACRLVRTRDRRVRGLRGVGGPDRNPCSRARRHHRRRRGCSMEIISMLRQGSCAALVGNDSFGCHSYPFHLHRLVSGSYFLRSCFNFTLNQNLSIVQVQPDPSPPPSAAGHLVAASLLSSPRHTWRLCAHACRPPRACVRARLRACAHLIACMDRRPCVRDMGHRNPTSYLICCDATLTSNGRQREDGSKLERPVY